jgi:hypothetical protein
MDLDDPSAYPEPGEFASGFIHAQGISRMMELGLDEEDACDVLASVTAEDCAGRIKSKRTREWMYVFKPKVVGIELYVKVLLRSECILISFHEDGSGFDE